MAFADRGIDRLEQRSGLEWLEDAAVADTIHLGLHVSVDRARGDEEHRNIREAGICAHGTARLNGEDFQPA